MPSWLFGMLLASARNNTTSWCFAVTYTLRVKGQSTPFQESPEDGYEASLDKGVICPAFDIALKKMKKGEKASLVIKSECKSRLNKHECLHMLILSG